MPVHGIQCNKVKFQNYSSLVYWWFILVHTGTPLESLEVGYSDIFLEYSIYLTTVTRSICLEYSDKYLEYVNPFPIPGICLEYAWCIRSESLQVYDNFMSGIFQIYTTHILSKSFGSMPGIYLDYSSACESACSSNAIGMQLLSQYTYFGCQGCLIFSARRGRHAWQRQSVSRCSPMWRSIDCDVAAATNPRKISWSWWCTHKTCTMHRQKVK